MKQSFEPRYIKIVNEIQNKINSGSFKVDQRVPSENEIKKMYNVSSTTARKSLDTLRNMGLIESIQGKGTFVRNRKLIKKNLKSILSFTRTMQEQNREASAKILEKTILFDKDIYHEKLGLDAGDPVLKLRRLRFGDGIPLVIDNRYINIKSCPDIVEKDLTKSLYKIYDEYELKIIREKQTIGIGYLDETDAKLLKCKTSDPVFSMTCVTYSEEDSPLEYEESYYKGKEFSFTVEATI